MESKEETPCLSPSPYRSSSSNFRDITNFKTPRPKPARKPDFQTPGTQFFTASKRTPRVSSRRPSVAPPSVRAKAARRHGALEIEQSKSARKALVQRERSLKSLAKSITVWLNFLFENPGSCGCESSAGASGEVPAPSQTTGKRDSFPEMGVRVDAAWRNPKRQRDSTWRSEGEEISAGFSRSAYSGLKNSLKDVCSFEDLKQRLQIYLSLSGCKEVFEVMTQVTKNIDEGRLKMKAHCPLVTDVGLKEKATRTLMGYNPVWLRIGLYIVFGGDSLLSDEDDNSEIASGFLRMVIEKQFFSHAGLAKAYAYNKMVEGLYRPGYYEALGNIILKRFLLLVLVLDRAKSQSSLPLKYGIDGVDGGSPLLFTVQSKIKSSFQVIQDFLSSDTMLGEGNVMTHLKIVGYKVQYQQNPLVEYDFKVSDLFEDLRDGVRLGRATQLLLADSSILMKLVVPSDTSKKHLGNCGVVMQYLRQAGVSFYDDDDGMMIVGDDIANGEKELTLSLLWNMFVHLQLPLLMKKTMLLEEINKIRGANADHLNASSSTPLELLLCWIKAICEKYNCRIDSFSSLVDGKAIWCLLDFYFRKELPCSSPSKDSHGSGIEESIVLAADYPDAVHNFLLSQKLTTLLGNFPEVLQVSEILEYGGACNDKSVAILLVFLASQLIVKKNMDRLNFHKLLGCPCQSPSRKYSRGELCFPSSEEVVTKDTGHNTEDAAIKFKAIQAWWQEMSERNYHSVTKTAAPILRPPSSNKNIIDMHRETAAKAIQSSFRRMIVRCNYVKMKKAAYVLQTVIRAWLIARNKPSSIYLCASLYQDYSYESLNQSEMLRRYAMLMIDRHRFVKLKKSVLIIQHAVKSWITWRRHHISIETCHASELSASVIIQKYCRRWLARSMYLPELSQVQKAITIKEINDQCFAAAKIQSHFRRWLLRRRFQKQKQATLKIQRSFRMSRCQKMFQNQKQAALKIQRSFRMTRLQKLFQKQKRAILNIQSSFRMSISKKMFQNQKQAILRIQSYFRMLRCLKTYQHHKILAKSATVLQSFVRRWIARREASQLRHSIIAIQTHCRRWLARKNFLCQRDAVIRIQSSFQCWKCRTTFECQRLAALHIQRFVRGEMARKKLLGTSRLCACTPCDPILKSLSGYSSFELKLVILSVIKLQRRWRVVLLKRRTKSAEFIQSCFRSWIAKKRNANRQILCPVNNHGSDITSLKGVTSCSDIKLVSCSVLKLQSWWRRLSLKLRIKSAIKIQSHVRGWIARRKANILRHHIVVIQSYWKGYLARKDSKEQLLDLRLRMEKTAANVDDSMRIINRLITAVSELLSKKSISGILHTVETLDMATQYSQKCCEELVKAKAINTLLKLINSVNRSVPDQEILRHTLSILRNLACYPHLVEALIDSPRAVQTILSQMLRDKGDRYFIITQLMGRICSSPKGIKAVKEQPELLKRLRAHVDELTKKANNKERIRQGLNAKENIEGRLKEAVNLLKMVTEGL